MADFEEHCDDCEHILGQRCEDVNKWMDELFRKFGPKHRCVRHNNEGVRKAFELWGERGRKAALIHILKDCGHIPNVNDYPRKQVDELGMKQPFNGYWDPKEFLEAAKKLVS